MSLKATNNVETNKYELEIEISAEDFEAAIEKAYLKARKNIAMPGFRKGKAPRKLIEKEYGEQVFFEDAVNLLYAPVVNGAVEESGLELVTRPEVEVTEISKENGVKLKATCITKPEVEVKDYKGIEVEKVVNPVTDEDINKQLDALREKNVTVETVDDRAAENGDDVLSTSRASRTMLLSRVVRQKISHCHLEAVSSFLALRIRSLVTMPVRISTST